MADNFGEDDGVLTSALTGAATGASVGGPIGGVIGFAVGGGIGIFQKEQRSAATRKAEQAKNRALLKASVLKRAAREQKANLTTANRNLSAAKPVNGQAGSIQSRQAPTGALGEGLPSSGTF